MDKEKLWEVTTVFLKLGLIAFGGPAAHTAMMKEEFVERRKWVSEQRFLDLMSASNLIPGPNSTELAIHLGYVRAGWLGLILAGACFILPAMLIVLALAYIYMEFGNMPELGSILYGMKPVIMAIVIHALWGLGKTAVKNTTLAIIGGVAAVLAFAGVNEILLLVLAGGLMYFLYKRKERGQQAHALLPPTLPFLMVSSAPALLTGAAKTAAVGQLFWTFLKIGSVLYGSGYVLLAFLQSEFVEKWQVLTPQQLLDAVAIGQFTPGPVFTTATFVGYVVAGTPGAIVSTVGIFLPAFVFVALVNPWVEKLRSSQATGALLDGINVGSLALMAVVTLQLGMASLIDGLSIVLALVSLVIVFRYKINSAWLVLGGGVIGMLSGYLS
ncbi:chromate transporter [Brevibacillus dissolubilis]|uniref:chromate transporter n=1 Tax=Brevibacillus dissolubilis TaxID=1844116 RepID=UPI001C3F4C82|nr:chromate transporter [Brevibacillus dissolubilis]